MACSIDMAPPRCRDRPSGRVVCEELATGAFLDEAAVREDVGAVGEGEGLGRVLLHDEDGNVLRAQGREGFEDEVDHHGSEAERWLVEYMRSPGSDMRARPMASICCSPPERWRPGGPDGAAPRGAEEGVDVLEAGTDVPPPRRCRGGGSPRWSWGRCACPRDEDEAALHALGRDRPERLEPL